MSLSLQKYPNLFPSFYTSLILIGEKSGQISEMLRKIYSYMNESEEIKQKMIQALTYPAIITGVTFISFVFLMTFVIPEFQTIFRDNKSDLPGITKFVLATSHFFTSYILYLLITLSLLLISMIQYSQTKWDIVFF